MACSVGQRARIPQPMLLGEALAGRHAFAPFIEAGAAGYLNPDIAACGGLLEMLAIATLAEPRQMLISPHNYNSMSVGYAATLQAAALIPNLATVEHFPDLVPDNALIGAAEPVIVQGQATLPPAPGLGLTPDDRAMEAYRLFAVP